jgi:hypothetical protein
LYATVVGQRFFDPLPAGRGRYLLNGVLSDWADSESLTIPRRHAEAAGAMGRFLVECRAA